MKWPRRFDFVALTVGACIPDLFEPYFNLVYNDAIYNFQRDLTHSLFGALTLDFVVALVGTVLLVRPLLRWMNRRWPSGLWSRFANQDFLARRSWPVTLASVWLGTLSHVLIDVPFHATFRLFAPFAPDSLIFYWRLQPLADVASTVLFGPLFGYLLYTYWWRPSRQVREAGASRARAN
ncbi:MAG: DUF4184 family protein [Methanobacteriota archaeon]|nr:MAG: DUF4184 family protein [Euryarchaeota archaeon]